MDFDLVPKNAAVKVKLPKGIKKEINVWNEEEVNSFLKVAKDDPCYIVFCLALTTRMCQGEILGLRWKDVNLNKGLIKIKRTLVMMGSHL